MMGRTGRFSRSDRLLRSRDFQRVAREGRRRASRHFVVLVAESNGHPHEHRYGSLEPPQEGLRLGVTVSRKVAAAVGRNRVKRRVREWFRRSRRDLVARVGEKRDIVVIARRGAAELSGSCLSAELAALLEIEIRV